MQKTNIAGLDRLLAEAKRQVAAMTPKQYGEMIARQRESFVRAMTTPCEHGELDFEQCPECRATSQPAPLYSKDNKGLIAKTGENRHPYSSEGGEDE